MPNFARRFIELGLRVFFYLLYHQFAWAYDLVAAVVSLGMWRNWVSSVIPYLDGTRILELGHGPGHLQAALAAERQVYGLDASPQMGRLAHRNLARRQIQPQLMRGVSQNLPFPAQTFDNVVATFPTEYIIQAATLAEIRRILTPGGKVVVLPLAWITGQRWIERLAAWVFKITGEAPQWDDRWLEPLCAAGFTPRLEWVTLGSSKLLIIIAAKTAGF
jgi:ubiquinone/menaquinone biosynthesis C-methylase UbiE